jgi:DNA-binding transcriptional LysR family regulator
LIYLKEIIVRLTYFLPDYISEFKQHRPYVDFNIVIEEKNSLLIDKLIKNQIDIALTYESVILRDDIQILKVTRDELVLALPGKHPWASGRLVKFEEILTLPFIFYTSEIFLQQILEGVLSGNQVNVSFRIFNKI